MVCPKVFLFVLKVACTKWQSNFIRKIFFEKSIMAAEVLKMALSKSKNVKILTLKGCNSKKLCVDYLKLCLVLFQSILND